MAAPPFHLPLFLAFLLLSTTTAAAAVSSHLHLRHHGPHHQHHHRSPSMTTAATARLDNAPSTHQNRMESQSEETRQPLRVLNPFFATTVAAAAQAPSAEDAMAAIGAAVDAGDTARLDLPSPPPSSLPAAADPMSSTLAPPQPQAEVAGSSQSEAAAPPPVVDEQYRDADAASPPPPPPVADEPYPYRDVATPPLPVHGDAARVVSSGTGDDLGLQRIAKVLASLGYNEMASSATLLADSTPVVTWPGAITVFAAPDVLLQASCPECSRRHLLLDHVALGYFPYAELAAAPARKLPSASVGFCLDVVVAKPQRGPFSILRYGSLYINGVMVSEPEIYDDGRYVVHGLHGFIPPLSHVSCVEDDAHAHHHHQVHLRHHHLSARSAATSTATGASVVRIMIWEAISRLRVSGFGVVALAMRVKFAELEKLSNLTVFALDDQVIFTGGGHGYVSAVRFHIVPGHRLTRADLLLLRPGTVLPTLAGEDQKLVITLGAGSATEEVCINKVPVKEPDVVINSRVAVHGIYIPFPRLHLAASVAVASDLHTRPKRDGAARPRQLASSGRHSEGFRVSSKLGRRDAGADKAGGRRAFASAAAAAGGAALVVLAALAVNRRRVERKRKQREVRQERVMTRKLKKLQQKPDPTACSACSRKDFKWKASGCGLKFCNNCLEKGFLDSHDVCRRGSFFCRDEECGLEPLEAPVLAPGDDEYVLVGEERISATTITKKYLKLDDLQERKTPKSLSVTYLKSDNRVLAVRRRSP